MRQHENLHKACCIFKLAKKYWFFLVTASSTCEKMNWKIGSNLHKAYMKGKNKTYCYVIFLVRLLDNFSLMFQHKSFLLWEFLVTFNAAFDFFLSISTVFYEMYLPYLITHLILYKSNYLFCVHLFNRTDVDQLP